MESGFEGRHEWRFKIGEAFPADDPLARFVVAVAAALNDNLLAHTMFVDAEKPFELVYLFSLASSHLYEASETFLKAHREWPEVAEFVATLDDERQAEFERVISLARPEPPWPGGRLKEIRNSFFHYFRLDRAAADAGRLPLQQGLERAAEMESVLQVDSEGPLGGIRAVFADEVAVRAMTFDYDDDELERLTKALLPLQIDLNRFAQGALGRYIATLPSGVVRYDGGSA
jgi:hypothetical protein